ncbi:SANT/Myb-like DNA-binding domain-containing protein [Bradyrhizobium diazoefficiens]|uniref:Myb-like domain-containing protein n=1 Tax=Bradyrhizobium diazoefficiens TaxID=1355477 RepID=A0A809YPA1_9BRAD|nr:SANT/Myb-like DNA-binding domain-containing protein [Bradyrhizobium diazoefficiens]BCA04182.1 hypothetical protein H12S4_50860 [Bradyrhizobium diazoefficiens]BCA21539.1 hypothetical protein BDHH15_47540 [Bradyrhizobium diazoefficiens]BCE39708.1 hypothetical protein XF3B_47390 [Bradyrhizobium diazoefficiens]BCF53104.1 hypothetical protein XF17B_47420 [Bradyrhizobium diazoefficiens]
MSAAERTCVRWSGNEDAELLRMRDVERLDWPEIAAALPGRSGPACEQRYYGKLKGARDRARRPRGPKPSVPAVSWRKRGVAAAGVVPEIAAVVAPAAPALPLPVVERKRMPLMDHLRERAELQLRIDRQGLTAAWFGDPPPGRSALDKRASGSAGHPQPSLAGGGSDG